MKSAARNSGKSTLGAILAWAAMNGQSSSNLSPLAFFRDHEREPMTPFFDEADNTFGPARTTNRPCYQGAGSGEHVSCERPVPTPQPPTPFETACKDLGGAYGTWSGVEIACLWQGAELDTIVRAVEHLRPLCAGQIQGWFALHTDPDAVTCDPE
jgi:hypothetical protein